MERAVLYLLWPQQPAELQVESSSPDNTSTTESEILSDFVIDFSLSLGSENSLMNKLAASRPPWIEWSSVAGSENPFKKGVVSWFAGKTLGIVIPSLLPLAKQVSCVITMIMMIMI